MISVFVRAREESRKPVREELGLAVRCKLRPDSMQVLGEISLSSLIETGHDRDCNP
jgi:hypothetical protein